MAFQALSHVCRLWVRVHTLGLPRDVRRSRIAEIESDIWEFCNDSHAETWSAAVAFGRRVAGGMLDDVAWRVELASPRNVHGFVAACASLSIAVAAGVGFFSSEAEPASALEGRPLALSGFAGPVRTNSPRLDLLMPPAGKTPRLLRPTVEDRPRPDFSGMWVMDASRSMSPQLASWDARRIAAPEAVIELRQSATSLREQIRGEESRARDAEYDLSGMVTLDRDAGAQILQRSSWQGDRLVTVTTRVTKGGAWSTIDIRSLAEDGTTLIVERVTEPGHRVGSYVEREPDAMRARVRDTFVRAWTQ